MNDKKQKRPKLLALAHNSIHLNQQHHPRAQQPQSPVEKKVPGAPRVTVKVNKNANVQVRLTSQKLAQVPTHPHARNTKPATILFPAPKASSRSAVQVATQTPAESQTQPAGSRKDITIAKIRIPPTYPVLVHLPHQHHLNRQSILMKLRRPRKCVILYWQTRTGLLWVSSLPSLA